MRAAYRRARRRRRGIWRGRARQGIDGRRAGGGDDLLRQHCQEVDLGLVRRYALSEDRVEQTLDAVYGRAPGEVAPSEGQPQSPGLPPASMHWGYKLIELSHAQPEPEPSYSEIDPRPYWEYE